jgi:predicted HicB family RNase H-like nuclease
MTVGFNKAGVLEARLGRKVVASEDEVLPTRKTELNKSPNRAVRVADDLWDQIVKAAQRAGESTGEWVRQACRDRLKA